MFVKWLSGKQVEVQLDGSALTQDLKAQDDCLNIVCVIFTYIFV